MLIGELHRHAATERLADHRHRRDAQRAEQVAQPTRVRAEAVVAERLRRLPMAEKVGSEHKVIRCERRHDGAPRRRTPRHPMHEQDGRTLTPQSVADLVTVDPDVPQRHPCHPYLVPRPFTGRLDFASGPARAAGATIAGDWKPQLRKGFVMLIRFDPFRETDHMTEEAFRPIVSRMPMDAYRRGDAFVVHFDLPGVRPDTIDLTVEQNTLTVTAELELTRFAGHRGYAA